MNRSRSLVLSITAAVLLVLLAACGSDSNGNDSTTSTPTGQTDVAAATTAVPDEQATASTESGAFHQPVVRSGAAAHSIGHA